MKYDYFLKNNKNTTFDIICLMRRKSLVLIRFIGLYAMNNCPKSPILIVCLPIPS